MVLENENLGRTVLKRFFIKNAKLTYLRKREILGNCAELNFNIKWEY